MEMAQERTFQLGFIYTRPNDDPFSPNEIWFEFNCLSCDDSELRLTYTIQTVNVSMPAIIKHVCTLEGRPLAQSWLESEHNDNLIRKYTRPFKKLEGRWTTSSHILTKSGRQEAFDPSNADHLRIVARLFCHEVLLRGSKLLAPISTLSALAAGRVEKEIRDLLKHFRENVTNEMLRNATQRSNNAYLDPRSILTEVFGSSCHIHDVRHPLENIALSEGKTSVFLPLPFDESTEHDGYDMPDRHVGPVFWLVTFGIDPYPFCVLLLASVSPIGRGRDYVTSHPQLLSIDRVAGRYSVHLLKVPYTLPQGNLEQAALLAMGQSVGEQFSEELFVETDSVASESVLRNGFRHRSASTWIPKVDDLDGESLMPF